MISIVTVMWNMKNRIEVTSGTKFFSESFWAFFSNSASGFNLFSFLKYRAITYRLLELSLIFDCMFGYNLKVLFYYRKIFLPRDLFEFALVDLTFFCDQFPDFLSRKNHIEKWVIGETFFIDVMVVENLPIFELTVLMVL
jgi:hypothetical protein